MHEVVPNSENKKQETQERFESGQNVSQIFPSLYSNQTVQCPLSLNRWLPSLPQVIVIN